MGRVPVYFRIHRHGTDAHLPDRPHDSQGDFATVGNEYFFHLENFA
jgi:hypothetical protein